MATNRGIPALPQTLIRHSHVEPTAPPADVETDDGTEPIEGQGRGEARVTTARPRRRKLANSAEKTTKRGLNLTDTVWDRLQLEAIRKRTTISAVAGDLLERNLPRLRIERDA